MTLTNILNNLSQLSETELRTLNRAACNQLKANRNAESARKRDLFSPGDHVQWNGRMGHTVGVIIRIKRKKDKPGRSPEKHNLSEIRKGKAPDPSIHAGDVILVNRNWLSIPLLIKELSPFGSATRF